MEAKGDRLLKASKAAKATVEYRKALAADPSRPGTYDKLIKAMDSKPGDWGEEEFAESVSLAMRKQEIEHPPIKQVHARLSPEWQEATKLALEILHAADERRAGELVEELVAMGEIASRALIGMLLVLKRAGGSEAPPHGD